MLHAVFTVVSPRGDVRTKKGRNGTRQSPSHGPATRAHRGVDSRSRLVSILSPATWDTLRVLRRGALLRVTFLAIELAACLFVALPTVKLPHPSPHTQNASTSAVSPKRKRMTEAGANDGSPP